MKTKQGLLGILLILATLAFTQPHMHLNEHDHDHGRSHKNACQKCWLQSQVIIKSAQKAPLLTTEYLNISAAKQSHPKQNSALNLNNKSPPNLKV